ncbi:MAG: hypothetical protein IJR07_11790 [Bacteroidaceae bacterium]|nr:hypothetical protein [Bacteroidaceae bacterium]
MTKAFHHRRGSLPPLGAVSPITRRSICHTPIGDTAMRERKPSDDP